MENNRKLKHNWSSSKSNSSIGARGLKKEQLFAQISNGKLKRGFTSEKTEEKEDPFQRNWSEHGLRVIKKTKLFCPETKWKIPIQRDWSENSKSDDNFGDLKVSPIKRK